MPAALDRISIELTNQCDKACWFCYNHSQPTGQTQWTVEEIDVFVRDCAANEVKAVSFGGGEPLAYERVFDVLMNLRGVLFRSLTTNGLLLSNETLDRLEEAAPDKIHVSIHFPGSEQEVQRVANQVRVLSQRGIRSGVNLLVQRSKLEIAARAAAYLRDSGIENDRIVYLPMRGHDTPSPRQVSVVAGDQPFQSMTCLGGCAKSPRFCSIGWDKKVAWCSYTITRRKLPELSFDGLMTALDGLGLEFCGGLESDES